MNGRRRRRLDAAPSILASAEPSIPHSDGTDCCIDVADVQNVNLIPLIVTFASLRRRRAVFPTSSRPTPDFHRPVPESHFLTEVSGLDHPPPINIRPSSSTTSAAIDALRRGAVEKKKGVFPSGNATGPSKKLGGSLQMSRERRSITGVKRGSGEVVFPFNEAGKQLIDLRQLL